MLRTLVTVTAILPFLVMPADRAPASPARDTGFMSAAAKKRLPARQNNARNVRAAARMMVPLMPGPHSIDTNPNQPVPAGVKEAMGSAWVDVEKGIIHAPNGMNKRTKAHELSHVFDHQVLNDKDRAKLAKIIHAPAGRDWYGGVAGPAEYFADYYAAAALGDRPGRKVRVKGGGIRGANTINLNYTPIGRKRLKAFKQELNRIGQRENLGFGPLFKPKRGPITGANPIENDG